MVVYSGHGCYEYNQQLFYRAEKARLIQKLAAAKRTASGGGGGNFQRARPRYEVVNTCSEHNHNTGLLTIHAGEDENN